MTTRAGIAARLKKIETRLQPAQQFSVVEVYHLCRHAVDEAHAAEVHDDYRDGDTIISIHVYRDCPHCPPATPRRRKRW